MALTVAQLFAINEINIPQFALYCGVDMRTVYRWRKQNRFPDYAWRLLKQFLLEREEGLI